MGVEAIDLTIDAVVGPGQVHIDHAAVQDQPIMDDGLRQSAVEALKRAQNPLLELAILRAFSHPEVEQLFEPGSPSPS